MVTLVSEFTEPVSTNMKKIHKHITIHHPPQPWFFLAHVEGTHFQVNEGKPEWVGQGEVAGCTVLSYSAWRLLQLAIEKAPL